MIITAWTGAMPTTSAFAKVSLTAATKTILQLAMGANLKGKPIAWGVSFDASAAGTPVLCELLETDVGATMPTAYLEQDIMKKVSTETALGSVLVSGTGNSGFGVATAEGTIAHTRICDIQQITPMGGYSYQWPLGREVIDIDVSKFLRMRITPAAAVDIVAFVAVEF